MAEMRGVAPTWQDELASLVEDTGIRYAYAGEAAIGVASPVKPVAVESEGYELESFRDQVSGFVRSWCEMVVDLGRGCWEILQQSVATEDSFIVKKIGKPVAKASGGLRFLNEYLPEDRDPAHAWPVIFFVSILVLAALNVNSGYESSAPRVKKVRVHPPNATRIMLPDGRYLAYDERGVPADRARFSVIATHSFLSSRLAGIPGIKTSLLEDFGVRLITYDLPGFGESNAHPGRNLNSSAFDILHLANAVNISDKLWVLGHSSGTMHAWAALKYIPDRIAGAAMFAPLVSPYDPSMTKEGMRRTWEGFVPKRKSMYIFARRFPRLLSFSYRRSFLSGKHGPIEKWLSLSLARKDQILVENTIFEDFWHRDLEESIRQGNPKPFIEEAALLVSNWGFSLSDLQVQKKCHRKGVFQWFKSMYTQAECELTGFLGPLHIWQGMEDLVATISMADYVGRVLPEATMYKLPNEGHFSYFYFCDECKSFRHFFEALRALLIGKQQISARILRKENWKTHHHTQLKDDRF